MSEPAPSYQPRLGGATPIALVPAPGGREGLWQSIHVDPDVLEPVGDDVFTTRLAVPPGQWLIWPGAAWALWIGERPHALPKPVRRRLNRGTSDDVTKLVDQLATTGVWCRDAALLLEDGWTPSRRADIALAALASRTVLALSGVFVDRSGGAARLEVSGAGVCWSDRPTLAIEWLLTAVDLPTPT